MMSERKEKEKSTPVGMGYGRPWTDQWRPGPEFSLGGKEGEEVMSDISGARVRRAALGNLARLASRKYCVRGFFAGRHMLRQSLLCRSQMTQLQKQP